MTTQATGHKYPVLIAVRMKSADKQRIEHLSRRHDLPESIVIRKALQVGLKKFDREALVMPGSP